MGPPPMGSAVLLVTHLPDATSPLGTPEGLLTLFGVYGDVLKLKFMQKSATSRSALVEMDTPMQAMEAQRHLDRCPLGGATLSVVVSRQQQIKDRSAMEFFNHPEHRYRGDAGPRWQKNLSPPSTKLHVSHLQHGTNEQILRGIFGMHGTVQSVRVFGNNPQMSNMAIVEMDSIHSAVAALILVHNKNISGQRLIVAFAQPPRPQFR